VHQAVHHVRVGDGQHERPARHQHAIRFAQGRADAVREVFQHAEGQVAAQRVGAVRQGVYVARLQAERRVIGAGGAQGALGVVQADGAEAHLAQLHDHCAQPAARLQDDPLLGQIARVHAERFPGAGLVHHF